MDETRQVQLVWDENNIEHLWKSHQVTPEDIEEALFGVDGEEVWCLERRDGEYSVFLGQTGNGRLLSAVGEYLDSHQLYIFAARDMNKREKRRYRSK